MFSDEDNTLARNLLALEVIDKPRHDKYLKLLKENRHKTSTEILVEDLEIDENIVRQTIATTFDIPEVDINDGNINIREEIIPNSICLKYKVIPINLTGMELTVAFTNPPYKSLIDNLKQESKKIIVPIIISLSNYRLLFRMPKVRTDDIISVSSKFNIDLFDIRKVGKERVLEAQRSGKGPSVEIILEEIIGRSLKFGAHDIHIEPLHNELRVRVDKNGKLNHLISLPKEFSDNLINVLKTKSGLNTFEKKKPQLGNYTVNFGQNAVDVHVNILPVVQGERVALKLYFKHDSMRNLDEVGFLFRDLRKLNYLLNKASGLILITGPSGSGKTTTLYASIKELNIPEKNILTLEDFLEFKLDFAGQVILGTEKSFTYNEALRAILRQKPNVLLISEIREAETGITAAEAAIAGNLVLSTMLSSNAIETIPRLLSMGIPPYWLAPAISGVVYQQLFRKICDKCKKEYKPNESELVKLGITSEMKGVYFYHGVGCEACNGEGYSGKTAIHEILLINEALKDLIYQNAPIVKMKEVAGQHGFKSIRYSAVQKILLGITTSHEVSRVLG